MPRRRACGCRPTCPTRCSPTRSNSIWAASSRRSEEHTSELQSLMRISYAVFCLDKKLHMTNARSVTPAAEHALMITSTYALVHLLTHILHRTRSHQHYT